MFLAAVFLSGFSMIIEILRVNKFISWGLTLIPLFLLFFIIGFNRDNRDYQYYEKAFIDNVYRDSFEIGYSTLVKFVNFLNFDHTIIVFLSGSLFLLILIKSLSQNNHVNLVIFFYCLYPLIYDINQIRNTLMYLLVVLSLIFIVKNQVVKHYTVLILALAMHKLAVVYLPFYYLCIKNRTHFMRILLVTSIMLFLLSPIVINILLEVFPTKMPLYLERRPGLGVIIVFIYSIIDYFTVWWIDKIIRPRLSEEDKLKIEVLYRFVWFPIIILPFAFYFIEVSRLQRNAILVKYIYCAIAMKYMTVKEKLITVSLLLVSIGFYFLILWYNSEFELFNYLNENTLNYIFKKYFNFL